MFSRILRFSASRSSSRSLSRRSLSASRNFSALAATNVNTNNNTKNSASVPLALGVVASLLLPATLLDAKCEPHEDAEKNEHAESFYIPPADDSKLKIFTGNGNRNLANQIAMHLGVQLGRATVKRFADGEVSVNVHDSVRGQDVYIVQPMAKPVNANLMELLLMITTLRRASARRITAVIPYYGYSRSTSKFGEDSRTPIAAADVATLLQVAGVDRVVAVDLHHAQIQGFFGPGCQVDNLDVSSIAIPYFETKFLQNPVIISPDANGAARAKRFRDRLIKHDINASLGVIVDPSPKERGWQKEAKGGDDNNEFSNEEIDSMELVGDVEGCDCIIFDDMIDSGGRIARASEKLKRSGAKRVFAFVTHGLFSGKALERLEKSPLVELVCVNSLPLPTAKIGGVETVAYSSKVYQLSVGALLAEAIRRIETKQSVSALFR